MARPQITSASSLLLFLFLPSIGSAAPVLAVWLDGNTAPDGGGNGIPFSLTAAFGASSFTLVTTAQLEAPGFLNGFDAGHPIDAGIVLPFTTNEHTLFLGYVTGFDSGNVVDQYGDNGLDALAGVPAIVANKAAIDGVAPPPVSAPPTVVLLGLGLGGLATWRRGRHAGGSNSRILGTGSRRD